jgi:hypothetical protein
MFHCRHRRGKEEDQAKHFSYSRTLASRKKFSAALVTNRVKERLIKYWIGQKPQNLAWLGWVRNECSEEVEAGNGWLYRLF